MLKSQMWSYHGSIPAVCIGIGIIRLDDTRIAGLQILSSRWLDVDDGAISSNTSAAVLRPLVERRFAVDTVGTLHCAEVYGIVDNKCKFIVVLALARGFVFLCCSLRNAQGLKDMCL